jgi:hypothetical protein
MLWGDREVHLVVPQQVIGCFNEQELQDAFDDDLLEDPPTIVQCRLGGRLLALVLRWR